MTDRADFEVSLVDKVSAPAKAADKALGRFIDKAGKLREANGRFVGSGQAAATSIGGVSGAFESLRGSASGALSVLAGNIMTGALSKLASLGAGVASAAWEMVTFGQSSALAFDQLAHDGDKPAELFEHASALAKRFGMDLFDTQKQYRKLLALQFDPKGIDDLIRMGADLRALGTDAEGVQGVITAIGQVKGKGKLQAEEKMQLAERGISGQLIDEEIGKLLGGKSTAEVQKLMQKGKVDAETGIEAIKNAIKRKLNEDNLGDAGANFADNTIEGILGKMRAWAQDTGIKGLSKVAEPLTRTLGDLFDKFRAFVGSEDGAQTIQRIADSLGKAAQGVGDFLTKLTVADVEKFFDKLESAAGTAERIGDGIQFVADVVGGIATAFDFVGTSIGNFFGGMLADAIIWADGLWALITDTKTSLFDMAIGLGESLVTGLIEGLQIFAKTLLGPSLLEFGSNAIDWLASAMRIQSPSRATMEMGLMLGEGLAIGADQSSGRVFGATTDLGETAIEGAMGPMRSSVASQPTADSNGGGGFTIERIEIPIHIDGARAGDAQELGEAIGTRVRLELESLFRSLALEG